MGKRYVKEEKPIGCSFYNSFYLFIFSKDKQKPRRSAWLNEKKCRAFFEEYAREHGIDPSTLQAWYSHIKPLLKRPVKTNSNDNYSLLT